MTRAFVRRQWSGSLAYRAAAPGSVMATHAVGGVPLVSTLQRSVGNHAVSTLLGGRTLQMKLQVGAPGDAYEREADAVAEHVVQRCACGGACGGSGACGQSPEEETIHRFAAGDAPSAVAPPEVRDVLRTPGMPLDGGARALMEPAFGHDFSAVRVHTDDHAARSARAVNAVAYTVGSDVVFDRGRYEPGSAGGRRLLAHELTHVVQQQSAPRARAVQRQLYPPIPIVINTNPSVEVNAVDARQETSLPWYHPARYTGPLANFFRGDITMTSVATMVTNVLTFLGSRNMQRLNVMDHGNASGVEIGSDWLQTPADVAPYAGTLGRLRSRFTSGGFVHMQNCEAGQNRALICALAGAFGVPVYAGTGYHNPVYGFNTGTYVSCDTGGTFNPHAGRPSTPNPPPRTPEMA